MKRRWLIGNRDPFLENYLSQELNITPLVSRLLINRGIRDVNSCKEFLYVSPNSLHDPFLIPDMEKAVHRLRRAIKSGEKILIWGDYDVDGVTGTAIYLNFFRRFNKNTEFYIPDRIKEGYGLNEKALITAESRNCDIILTVDCGISSTEAINLLQGAGIDVIVTDHHEPPERLPDALAILNPCRKDSLYPFRGLTGAGVAFKLIQALVECFDIPVDSGSGDELLVYLDLVTLGTIADVAPLIGENRYFVKEGLKLLTEARRTGIAALKEVSGIGEKEVTSGTVSFILAPRINASGRLCRADDAVRLLTTTDMKEAITIATSLDRINQERQKIEGVIKKEIMEELSKDDCEERNVIVMASSRWHQGVIGIVASKITEEFYRPCILISIQEDGTGKGSARSIPGFNIYEGLNLCKDLLEKYGGHRYAAGLVIKEGNIPHLRDRLSRLIEEKLTEDDFIPVIMLDGEVELEEISFQMLKEISLLPPYGVLNPEPVVITKKVRVQEPRVVGRDHLKLRLRKGRTFFNGIGFSMASAYNDIINKETEVDVAYTPELNFWNGTYGIHLKLKDIKVSIGA